MRAARFDYLEPRDLDEALAALSEHSPDAVAAAGGTDLLRDLRQQKRRPSLVISLARIPVLSGVRSADDGGLLVGPMTTMAALASDPLVADLAPALAEAAGHMGSPQVRNRATIGGNLCNARPCADTAPPVIVHGARLQLSSKEGIREVEAESFITGPGATLREPHELLTAIQLPPSGVAASSAFETLTNRKAVEITITSATAWLELEGDLVKGASICLGSVGPRPMPGPSGAAVLLGVEPTPERIAQAASATVLDASPIDDFRGSADYRRHLVEVLTRRALTRALARARRRARGGDIAEAQGGVA